MLKLRIENFDQLPDGGPIEFVADRRGFDFGREQHLDWTLPDPSGVISRKHCEVRFFEQAYWLFDLSTNGTFVNKNTKRVQSPHRLSDGDEIRIGDYVISVTLVSSAAAPVVFENAPSPPSYPVQSGNIWDAQDMPPPMDPRELAPATPEIRRAPDYLRQVVHLPPVVEPSPYIKPAPARRENTPVSDLWGSPQEPALQPAPQPAVLTPLQATPVTTPSTADIAELPFQPSAPMYRDASAPPALQPQPVHNSAQMGPALLARFCQGAGLPPDTFNGRDQGEAMEDVGRLLNLFCGHFMELLNARAAAKTLSRSGSRTLIQARNNNPLKFMPTAEDALRIMLSDPTPSYMEGEKAVQSGFEDIRSHQLASLSAMQRAVSDLVEEFSPKAIKAQADGKKSLLGTGKGKYWETYVERWEARTAGKEFGMLSVFFDAFAQYYDKETGSKS